jgi:fucose 4-O-acetylase-like acetyltransferase
MSKGSLMMIFASLVTCSLLGISIVHFYKKPVVWNVDAALIVIAFFGLGYITKNFYGLLSKITFPYILPIYLTASLVIGMNNKSIDIFSNSFGNFFMFYLAALSGIGITLTISKLINKNVILQFAGKNTLLLLPLHTMIYNVLEKFIPFPENMDPLKSILLGFVFVAVALSISVFIINLINKQFPFLAGKTAPNNTKTTVSQSL